MSTQKSRLTGVFFILLLTGNEIIAQPTEKYIHDGKEFIVQKFDDYDVIALGESHGLVEVTDFYISLVKDEEFREKVDAIIFEIGNSRYQEILDDYVFGKDLSGGDIRSLWREHTSSALQSGDWTGVMRFFDAVREVNSNSDSKIRIIAADPPINWEEVSCTMEFYRYLGQRDNYYADIVKKEILDKGLKALLIMGNGHFNKKRTDRMIERNRENPITRIMQLNDNHLYLINSLTLKDFLYNQLNGLPQNIIIETLDPWIGGLTLGPPFISAFYVNEQTDAFIYYGEPDQLTDEQYTAFNDSEYVTELNRRRTLPECSN